MPILSSKNLIKLVNKMAVNQTDWAKDAENLRREIEGYFNLDPKNLEFVFSPNEDEIVLNLFTIGTKHQQKFLFHSAKGGTHIEALVNMLEYLRGSKSFENSYTIQWSIKGDSSLHTSYFRASDIFQALEKFSFARDKNTMVVFSVTLNPIS